MRLGLGITTTLVIWATGFVIMITTRNKTTYEAGLSPEQWDRVGTVAFLAALVIGFVVV